MTTRFWERFYIRRNASIRHIPLLAIAIVLGLSGTALAIAQTTSNNEWLPGFLKTGVQDNKSYSTQPLGSALDTTKTDCAMENDTTPLLEASTLPQLQKLQEYEAVCKGKVTDTMMMFTSMPSTSEEASSLSQGMAANLKEFSKYNIRPVVIMEPTTVDGMVNFKEYRDGVYDTYMEAYFQNLKNQGVTDTMMGMWVPFPEPNIPEWDDTTIEDTVANITKTITMQKKYFPSSKASVLLDSMSYPPGSRTWSGGEYKSLIPYVSGIPKGLVDSFGYQGFPWSPPQNEGGLSQANLSASQFLQAGLAIDAAKALGVTEVWLNTGSFNRSHASDPSQEVTIAPEKRSEIMQSIIIEAQQVQNAGFGTAIHVFAEDKSTVGEGVDWSYWQSNQAESSPSTPLFKSFVATAREHGFQFWLFDTKY